MSVQIKDEVLKRLGYIEEISTLNQENYKLKLNTTNLSDEVKALKEENQHLKRLNADKL